MLSRIARILKYRFGDLSGGYFEHRSRVAVIFSKNNVSWTYQHIDTHSKALSNGFKQILNFVQDDSILVKLSHQYLREKFLVKVAASSLKSTVHVSKAKNLEQLAKELLESRARSFVFDSYGKMGDMTIIDAIYRLIPEVIYSPHNKEIMPKNFSYLRSLIQADNYKFKGVFSFQNLMKYGLVNDYKVDFTCVEEVIKLDKIIRQRRPIIITDPCEQLAFRAGVLNCLSNGYLLVCASPEEVKAISENFDHQVDVICTEPMTELHQDNRVFLASTSKLYQHHPQRIQIVF